MTVKELYDVLSGDCNGIYVNTTKKFGDWENAECIIVMSRTTKIPNEYADKKIVEIETCGEDCDTDLLLTLED